jgi:hypothetical protein
MWLVKPPLALDLSGPLRHVLQFHPFLKEESDDRQ